MFLDTSTFPGVDSLRYALHDICMMLETETKGGQRRSSRVFTRIPVRATGRDLLGKKFQETSQTIVINAHGGLLYLQAELKVGAELVLINPGTEEEQDCRVVVDRQAGKQEPFDGRLPRRWLTLEDVHHALAAYEQRIGWRRRGV